MYVLQTPIIDPPPYKTLLYTTLHHAPLKGFKPGQRKVMFACFKRNVTKEAKVAQLAGTIAEMSSYHHGEVISTLLTYIYILISISVYIYYEEITLCRSHIKL